jgi:hypothetical protein
MSKESCALECVISLSSGQVLSTSEVLKTLNHEGVETL